MYVFAYLCKKKIQDGSSETESLCGSKTSLSVNFNIILICKWNI